MRAVLPSSILLVGLCLLAPSSSWGEEGPASAPAAGSPLATAREHFLTGEVFYRTGRFQQAIEAYQRALKIDVHPSYIFNIAQCHRQLGHLEAAIFHYRLFLSDWQRRYPTTAPPWREETEAQIRALTARLKQRGTEMRCEVRLRAVEGRCRCDARAAAAPVDGAGTPGAPATPAWLRPSSWAAVGVGGAALVSGIVLGGLAVSRAGDYNKAAREGVTFGELEDLRHEVGGFERASVSTLAVGAVLAAVGGSFLLWDWLSRWRSRPSRGAIQTALSSGGAGLLAGARF
jgi:tetratricopeptide (TPR) repeat protein